jgi:TonB family protein
MRHLIRSSVLLLWLFSTIAIADDKIAVAINVFQGFRTTATSPSGPAPLVFHLPPERGWPEDIGSQRQRLKAELQLEGAAFVAGRRAIVSWGDVERVETYLGRLAVTVRPRRTTAGLVKVDVSIISGKDAQASTVGAAVSGPVGSTFVFGGRPGPLPDLWVAAEMPVLVAVTVREQLSEPSVWPVDGDVVASEELSRVGVVYPPEAKKAGKEGAVIIDVIIDETGAISWTEIAHHADQALDDAALAAVRQWRYRPATRNGKPVATWRSITVRFKTSWDTTAPTPSGK